MQIYNQGKFIIKANLYRESKNNRKKKKKRTTTKTSNKEKKETMRSPVLHYKYKYIVKHDFTIKTS